MADVAALRLRCDGQPGSSCPRDSGPRLPSDRWSSESMLRCLARKASVTSGEPSRIMRWTVMRLLSTTVHVVSRSLCCRARKTSPTPASPECVATRMCSMYFVLGGAFWGQVRSAGARARVRLRGAWSPSIVSHLDLGRALDGLFEGARHGAGAARVGCAVVSGELAARTQMAG